jgi:hypothetical protein
MHASLTNVTILFSINNSWPLARADHVSLERLRYTAIYKISLAASENLAAASWEIQLGVLLLQKA